MVEYRIDVRVKTESRVKKEHIRDRLEYLIEGSLFEIKKVEEIKNRRR